LSSSGDGLPGAKGRIIKRYSERWTPLRVSGTHNLPNKTRI
jgi:hypothetical protein